MHRPAIDQHQPAAEQGRRDGAVLPADRVYEQCRGRDRQQHYTRVAGEPERAIESVPGGRKPDEQRRYIGNERQRHVKSSSTGGYE